MVKIKIDTIHIERDSKIPLYIQIAEQIKDMILNRELEENYKLPPIRKFAKILDVNNITIINAYKNLEMDNLVEGIKGSGYYVRTVIPESVKKHICEEDSLNIEEDNEYKKIELSTNRQIEVSKNAINFASATPDPSIFPVDTFKNSINEVLDRDKGNAFGYLESNGYEPLREVLCEYLLCENKIETSSQYLQIVSGAQQGIDIVGKSLLNFGDYVITENPTYTGAVDVFKSRGAKIIGINIMEDGIDCGELEEKIKFYKPKLLYIMTNFQNPTTVSYSLEKLKVIIDLSKKYDFYIIEDDSLSGICFKENEEHITLKSMDTYDRVIYIRSFSKMIMPGLRMGFIVSPKSMIERIIRAKHTTDISSSGLTQRALHIYFQRGYWKDNLEYIKNIYESKYDCMVEQLNKLKKYGIKFKEPNGGLNFWVNLPPDINAYDLYIECAKKGVLILPAEVFYVNPHKENYNNIRLSYAGSSIEYIKKGMNIIEKCIYDIVNNRNKTYITPFL